MFDRTHQGPKLTCWSSDDQDHTSDHTQSLVIKAVMQFRSVVFAYSLLVIAYSQHATVYGHMQMFTFQKLLVLNSVPLVIESNSFSSVTMLMLSQ